jgi:hypothetical protein
MPFSPRLTKRPSEFHVRSPATLVASGFCKALTHYPCFEHRHDPLCSSSALRRERRAGSKRTQSFISFSISLRQMPECRARIASGKVHQHGKVGATRWELDAWLKTLPQPWTAAMEATIFTGWVYDHLKPHESRGVETRPGDVQTEVPNGSRSQ